MSENEVYGMEAFYLASPVHWTGLQKSHLWYQIVRSISKRPGSFRYLVVVVPLVSVKGDGLTISTSKRRVSGSGTLKAWHRESIASTCLKKRPIAQNLKSPWPVHCHTAVANALLRYFRKLRVCWHMSTLNQNCGGPCQRRFPDTADNNLVHVDSDFEVFHGSHQCSGRWSSRRDRATQVHRKRIGYVVVALRWARYVRRREKRCSRTW